MGEVNWTPDEFARLMALPPAHPDRVAAEADPAFEAWARMAGAFEAPAGGPLDEAALRPWRAELAARLERSLAAARATADSARANPPALARGRQRGVLEIVSGWLATPPGRAAFAVGVVAIVAVTGWWTVSRREVSVLVRGGDVTDGAPRIADPVAAAGAVTLKWSVVAGADRYRLVFYSAEMGELARLDSLAEPRATLRAGALPAGLAGGTKVEVEVVALAHGDPLSRSKLVPVTLP